MIENSLDQFTNTYNCFPYSILFSMSQVAALIPHISNRKRKLSDSNCSSNSSSSSGDTKVEEEFTEFTSEGLARLFETARGFYEILEYAKVLARFKGETEETVTFDASVINDKGASCFVFWSVDSEGTSKEDVEKVFALLKRSGGATLNLALAKGVFYRGAFGSAFPSSRMTRNSHALDVLLNEPFLRSGWDLFDGHGRTPLMERLRHYTYYPQDPIPYVHIDTAARRVVSVMSDEAINAVDLYQRTLFYYCLRGHFWDTLRKLLLRPSLDVATSVDALKFVPLETRPKIDTIFAEVAPMFSSVPKFVQDALYQGLFTLDLPVAQIIADYYYKPIPRPW